MLKAKIKEQRRKYLSRLMISPAIDTQEFTQISLYLTQRFLQTDVLA